MYFASSSQCLNLQINVKLTELEVKCLAKGNIDIRQEDAGL